MESTCPTCRAKVTVRRPENASFPFCSSRCRAVDLGRWIDESYRIVAEEQTPSEGDTPSAATPSWES